MTIKSFCIGTIHLEEGGITYSAARPDSGDILSQLTCISLTPSEERYGVKEEHLFETKEKLKDYWIKTISAL